MLSKFPSLCLSLNLIFIGLFFYMNSALFLFLSLKFSFFSSFMLFSHRPLILCLPISFSCDRQLMNKMKLQGTNAIFGLQMNLAFGNDYIIAVASGTSVFFRALPPPQAIEIEIMNNRKFGLENMRRHGGEHLNSKSQHIHLRVCDSMDVRIETTRRDLELFQSFVSIEVDYVAERGSVLIFFFLIASRSEWNGLCSPYHFTRCG